MFIFLIIPVSFYIFVCQSRLFIRSYHVASAAATVNLFCGGGVAQHLFTILFLCNLLFSFKKPNVFHINASKSTLCVELTKMTNLKNSITFEGVSNQHFSYKIFDSFCFEFWGQKFSTKKNTRAPFINFIFYDLRLHIIVQISTQNKLTNCKCFSFKRFAFGCSFILFPAKHFKLIPITKKGRFWH